MKPTREKALAIVQAALGQANPMHTRQQHLQARIDEAGGVDAIMAALGSEPLSEMDEDWLFEAVGPHRLRGLRERGLAIVRVKPEVPRE